MFNQTIHNADTRRETLSGTEYVVTPITLLKPMNLNVPANWGTNEAYLPEQEAKESIPSWNGTPLTLNHPSQGGTGASANSPEMHAKTVLGRVFNAEWDSGAVQAEAWFDEAKIRDMGGMAENALERVLQGDVVEVSTGYRASRLPSGTYDGESRNAVQGNLKPDHVAVLPNKQGKCSVDAGCGVGEPVANSLIFTNVTTNQEFEVGDLVRWQTQASPGTGRVAEVVTEPGEQVVSEADVDNPPVREATEDEAVYKLDDWNGEEFVSGQVVKSASEMLGTWDNAPDEAMAANAEVPDEFRFDNPGEAVEKAQEMGFEGSGEDLIHTHGEGAETVFMPGPSHQALLDELDMAANQDMALTDVTPDDVSSYTDSEWDGSAAIAGMPNPSEDSDAPEILDAAHLIHPTGESARDDKSNWKLPFRQGPDEPVNTRALVAAKAALQGARGGVEGISLDLADQIMSRIDDLLLDAPGDMFGSMSDTDQSGHMDDDMGENTLERIVNFMASFTDSDSDESAESDTDVAADTNSNMSEKTQELVDNHGFKAANLPEEDTDCFAAIYNRFVESEAQAENKGGVHFESEEAFEEKVEEIVSNRQAQSEKQRLASEIAANSTAYDDAESVLTDFPTKPALNSKRKDVLGAAADFSGTRGASAEPATNADDADDLKMFGGDA